MFVVYELANGWDKSEMQLLLIVRAGQTGNVDVVNGLPDESTLTIIRN